MNKLKEFNKLIDNMGKCERCTNIYKKENKKLVDCSLINIYKNKEFCLNIPTIWTDWYTRIDSDIMIIGDDWGPYTEMSKYREEYIKELRTDEDAWENLVNKEDTLIHKNLVKFLTESAKLEKFELETDFLNHIYFTNAVMCARQGESYKDTKCFDAKECTINCILHLIRQIEIVRPKIIITLGYYPLLAISKIFDFEIKTTLQSTLEETNIYEKEGITIIPAFHPVSQIKQINQIKQYRNIWKKLNE